MLGHMKQYAKNKAHRDGAMTVCTRKTWRNCTGKDMKLMGQCRRMEYLENEGGTQQAYKCKPKNKEIVQ